jgi:hypothetical protein
MSGQDSNPRCTNDGSNYRNYISANLEAQAEQKFVNLRRKSHFLIFFILFDFSPPVHFNVYIKNEVIFTFISYQKHRKINVD